MGDAPRIIEALRLTREELQDIEQERYLDTASGEVKVEPDSAAATQVQSRPMPVARQTFD